LTIFFSILFGAKKHDFRKETVLEKFSGSPENHVLALKNFAEEDVLFSKESKEIFNISQFLFMIDP